MTRFFVSLLVGALLGTGIGLVLGWGVFPTETVGNPASSLAQEYRDAYTVMIAAGYRADGDLVGAVERLRVLGIESAGAHVQEVTQRYIDRSRDVDSIYHLVALAEALDRLTPEMEPFRQINTSVSAP
ncbi:MAG: hypothetical protein ACOCX3_01275 [Chloroflexota bacterium]